jgi:hypothetical protein
MGSPLSGVPAVRNPVMYRLVAAKDSEEGRSSYNLRSFPPTLQYRFGSRSVFITWNDETVGVGVIR